VEIIKYVVYTVKMKKAQSISINTIVIALIALLVLIVVIAVLSGNIKIFTGGTSSCASRGGTCGDPRNDNCKPPYYAQIRDTNCDNKVLDESTSPPLTEVCCVEIQTPFTPEEPTP